MPQSYCYFFDSDACSVCVRHWRNGELILVAYYKWICGLVIVCALGWFEWFGILCYGTIAGLAIVIKILFLLGLGFNGVNHVVLLI